uniref:Putative glycine-rich secreted protein n=1 Tax=Amblyomma cajennense TaxID=34607 RepID=A0A023FT77_AMBCJ
MGAALFWMVVLATTVAQDTLVRSQSLFRDFPWESQSYHDDMWPYTYDSYGSSWQTRGLRDMGTGGLLEDTGGVKGTRGASMGGSSSSRFGGDYGFPRYGGSARVSRYGIDYGSRRNRRRLSSGYSFASSYADSGSYPRYTNEFHGREHPQSWYWYW